MSRVSKILLMLTIFVVGIFTIKVNAVRLDKTSVTLKPGQTANIGVYATVEEAQEQVSFPFVYSSYKVPASFNAVSPHLSTGGSNSYKVTLGEHIAGEISIGTVTITALNDATESATVTIDGQTITVNIDNPQPQTNTQTNNQTDTQTKPQDDKPVNNEQDETTDYNLLKSIDSDIVNIKLEKDKFEYEVTITDDIKELDLKPVTIDEKYKATIKTQKIEELKDNEIVINVTDGKISKDYKIKVKIKEKDEQDSKDENIKEEPTQEENSGKPYEYKGKIVAVMIIFIVLLGIGFYLLKKKK